MDEGSLQARLLDLTAELATAKRDLEDSRKLLRKRERELAELATKKVGEMPLTSEEAYALLGRLSSFFGEPVKPIGEYCHAFKVWLEAFEAAYRRETDDSRKQSYLEKVRTLRGADLLVRKSNLLARLLYGGETLREQPCPIHKGYWDGCAFLAEDACPHCMSDANVTGWVRNGV